MTKAPQAFRTISEVSETLDVPQHVLRFWEGKFTQIKPLKRAGGRRYYRPDDIELLRGIRALLYAEGYTIKGVQKLLRVSGARYVSEIGRLGVKRAGRADASWDGRVSDGFSGAPDPDGTHEMLGDSVAVSSVDGNPVPSGATLADDTSAVGSNVVATEDRPEFAQAGLSDRRARLEAALEELLALRDLLRARRPKRAEAA